LTSLYRVCVVALVLPEFGEYRFHKAENNKDNYQSYQTAAKNKWWQSNFFSMTN